ncbi:MAG: Asp-tRNA(Asn)/Glu-tRNA(Gln) amidotransferase subunit GatC [Candidatus Hydrogenedens sp.]|jgi:aspartyl-tRNA(Asn)/glutamyl-tRNA(Gln) amidotransferase subunit C|nr:Asp-tRNA(Asn)/Glu-tRNA(Gln) amidotransferase subunit GatC [Candidatus Hydrogenedens sp.]
MDGLTEHDIARLASSAQLYLDDNTRAQFTREINKILEYVQVLEKVDTEGVAPTRHATDRLNVFREDIPQTPLPVEEVFKNSPLDDGSFFLVPRIIDGEENS